MQIHSPVPECACRSLPGEVTWINTILARVVFDVMRDPDIIQRLQDRIQRKLHTLKVNLLIILSLLYINCEL